MSVALVAGMARPHLDSLRERIVRPAVFFPLLAVLAVLAVWGVIQVGLAATDRWDRSVAARLEYYRAHQPTVLVSRYEELSEEVAPLDIVCSRALGDFGKFLTWAGSPQIGARQVMLWLGAEDAAKVSGMGGWNWREAVPIPHSLRRYILIGDKIADGSGW